MKERPILFSAPMVRALLAGRKTQTRRALNPQPLGAVERFHHIGTLVKTGCSLFAARDAAGQPVRAFQIGDHSVKDDIACPYGSPGDRLWVRETYAIVSVDARKVHVARAERMPAGKTLADTDGGLEIIEVPTAAAWWAERRIDTERWKPAIFMPRWACRIVLEVTNVRVERLQQTSAADAREEGFVDRPDISSDPEVHRDASRDWYMDLWNGLNAKRGLGWNRNPWVWVVSFRCAEALKAAA